MRLIAILLALWANHHPHHADRWRSPVPFLRYLDWARTRLPARFDNEGALQLSLILVPPVLLFTLLQVWLEDWLFGLAEIALGVWALLFLHGSGHVDSQLENFLEAWREGRSDSAHTYAAELAGRDISAAADTELPVIAAEGIFWQTYRRLLVGIFWLLIVGPVGPVAVRLAVLTRDAVLLRNDSLTHYSSRLVDLLDWLPARAAALSFALAGSFVHAREGWQESQQAHDPDPRRLVTAAGIGALNLDDSSAAVFDADDDDAEDFLEDARQLVGRSLMVWVGVAALLTIAGWLY